MLCRDVKSGADKGKRNEELLDQRGVSGALDTGLKEIMTTFYCIKPANILMGNEEILKVTDFGLVRVGDATAEIAGKIEYFYREKA